MELKEFEGQNRDELSMIEVAHAILENKGDVIDFSDLVNAIQNYLGKSDAEIRDGLSQFYTDLNIDGSFISLGENRWGLRSWYAIDEVDEEISHVDEDEEEENRPRKKKKRINAFATSDDDDIIDYNDDDPEDDYDVDEEDDLTLDDDDDDEADEVVAYDSDLKEIILDDEEVEDDVEVDVDDDDEDDFVEEDEEEK
ncbi:DNA-directed RNA polymerase subunit delta [Pilibacter termitis]|uniref:DNA-directed RNA polymerase subunit delta n=1 Tax=Pilibacter termitis TaxID=263852 RepID=UPI00099AF695|nr:DNA-directed RNA polymerase subunit delta [Pilibacter termitis]